MTPSAPIQNFRLPRFAENGYTQWVLQGGRGIYDSAEQIRIEAMAMRVYSADERMALEMTMESPEATLLPQQNRALSAGPIEIVGANFKVSGVGWEWDGVKKEIEIKFDVVVEFTQGIADSLQGMGAGADAAGKTEIHSGNLVLQTTAEAYRFEFTQAVHVASADMDLKSEVLIALADAPQGQQSGAQVAAAGQLNAVRQLIAQEQVVIEQAGRVLRAGHAEFLLRERQAQFSGLPQIQAEGAYLSGASIHSQAGELTVHGSAEAGRAQMIVSQAGGLGLLGGAALSDDTIVLADSIVMRELESENRFVFGGSVEVMSGALQLHAQTLTLFADQAEEPAAESEADDAMRVGEVRRVCAEGAVRIEQEGQQATCEQVVFYPQQQMAELSGDPRVTHREAIVVGERMQLKPGLAIVTAADSDLIEVRLPVLPDLGYALETDSESDSDSDSESQPASSTPPSTSALAESDADAEAAKGAETRIQARSLRMIEAIDHTLFRFDQSVSVAATNLQASCARLEVTARPARKGDAERLQIEQVEAHDEVLIEQRGRVASGDKATILPVEGKVVLEGNAEVTDERGRVSGHRMVLLQGERRAIVEGGGPDAVRAKVTLPAMQPANL